MRNHVWALMIVGTDDDIAGYTISHLLAEGIDKILIDLVPVEDRTKEILFELQLQNPGRIEIMESDDVSIWGSRRMTRLANIAYEAGTELVLPCDSDELFFSKNGGSLADEIRNSQGFVFACQVYNHVASIEDNSEEKNPYKRMVHRMIEPLGLPKIYLRFNPKIIIDEGNHGAHWQGGGAIPTDQTKVEMRHFPYRTRDQFVSKVRVTKKAMDATLGYPMGWGVHYRVYAETLEKAGEDALKEWFDRWFCIGLPNSEDQTFVENLAPYHGAL